MIEIREYTDMNDAALQAAWAGLETAGACPHVFLSASWVRPWAARFAEGMQPRILVGIANDEAVSRVVGVAPFFRTSSGRLELPANYVSQRGGFIVRADEPADVRAFRAAALTHLASRRARLLLRSLTAADAAATWDSARVNGFLLNRLPGRISPFVDTSGSWDEFVAGKPRKVTHEWERKMRKLGRAGTYEVKRLMPGSDPHPIIDAMIEIEEKSWKEESGTSISQRGVADFYHEIAESFRVDASGGAELLPFWLELDGRRIGFLLGIAYFGTYYALKTTFDEEFRKLAPGVALFHHAISYAFEHGFDRFDFVGQRARWKDEWATGHTEHSTLRCYPKNLPGVTRHFVDTHLKRVGKRVVGEGTH